MKKVLVTGGCGFIGHHLVKHLLNSNYEVVVLDNQERGDIGRLEEVRNDIEYYSGDIRNSHDVHESMGRGVDGIIHLAFINGTKYFYSKPVLVLDIAIKGILNTIQACISNKIKELYLASSSEVYQTPKKIPTDESESLKVPDIYNPRYSYGGGKILTELMGIHYGKKYFKKLIIFRPHNVYGTSMGNEHVIPEFIRKFKNLKNKKFKIQGTGNEIRSFIYIKDFVQAFDLVLSKGKHLNIYNIGTNEKIKIKNLAYKMSKIYKKKIILKKTKLTKGSTKIRVPNISKIKKLGFKPNYNLDRALKEIK